MNTVERVISICEERKISMHKLETTCGISNGYIKGLKKGFIPDDKLEPISNFLNLSMEYLRTGKESEKNISDKYAELNVKIFKDSRLEEALIKYFNFSEKKKNHVLELIDLLYEDEK